MHDTYVALGDSFTEGLDDRRPDGGYRGWADLVAAELGATTHGFRYANLAVRGRRLQRIADEQVPLAEAMSPSLVTVSAGGNDIISLRCDTGVLGESMHELLERLVRTAGTVVVFTGFDPGQRLPMSRVLSARASAFNASVRSSAELLGARVVDLWTLPRLPEPRMWADDRLHLSSDGHALVADSVLDVLGMAPRERSLVREEQPAGAPWLSARRSDAMWVGAHFAPWVGRKLRGRSTGDLLDPKRPQLSVVTPTELSRIVGSEPAAGAGLLSRPT